MIIWFIVTYLNVARLMFNLKIYFVKVETYSKSIRNFYFLCYTCKESNSPKFYNIKPYKLGASVNDSRWPILDKKESLFESPVFFFFLMENFNLKLKSKRLVWIGISSNQITLTAYLANHHCCFVENFMPLMQMQVNKKFYTRKLIWMQAVLIFNKVNNNNNEQKNETETQKLHELAITCNLDRAKANRPHFF